MSANSPHMSYQSDSSRYSRVYLRDGSVRSWQVEPPTLGYESMSVFRQVNPNQLSDTIDTTRLALSSLMKNYRGEQGHGHAVSLVELREPAHQKALDRVPVDEAIEMVYSDVASLRQVKVARPIGIALVSRSKVHEKSLTVTLHPDDEAFFKDERRQIIDTLEGLAEQPVLHKFNWLRNKVPHISLGKLALGRNQEVTDDLLQPIIESLPDKIIVGKAVLHSPGVKKQSDPFGGLKNIQYWQENRHVA